MTTQQNTGFTFDPFAQFQKPEAPAPRANASLTAAAGSVQVLQPETTTEPTITKPEMTVVETEQLIDADAPVITPAATEQATAAAQSETPTTTEEKKVVQSGLNLTQMVTFPDIDLDHPATCGADINVKWRGSEDVDKVREAFKAKGIDERFWPEPPTPSVALKRAVTSVFKGALFNVSAIGKGAGWSVSVKDTDALAEHLAAGDAASLAEASKKAWALKMTCNVVREGDSTTIKISPPDHPAAENVRKAYEHHSKRVVFSEDISVLFSVKVLAAAHVSGRGQGDTWFVLKGPGMDLVRSVADAVHSVSTFDADGKVTNGGKIFLLPKILTSGVMEAVIDSLIEDADRAIEKMQDDLSKVGERALSSRIGETRRLRSGLDEWAKLAGRNLPAVMERLNEMEKELAVARENAWKKAEQV